MSDLINIEREMVRLCTALELLTTEYEGLCRVAADSRCNFDIAWAQALLRIDQKGTTVSVREAIATQACESLMREARISEAVRDAAKERIRALEAQLTVHQSRLRYLDEGKRF